jgi:zinc transport system substrate-binding protein
MKNKIIFVSILAVLAAAVLFSGCVNSGHVHDENCNHGDSSNVRYQPLNETQLGQIASGEKILVAASVVPQTEFIEKVGGDRVIAISMIPVGGGHHYDPTLRQLEELAQARLYMQLGSGEPFENNNMRSFTQINPTMKVVNSSVGIVLIQEGRSTDPHIWTSPKCAQIMVENTYKGLAEVDPEYAEEYRKNADAYILELQELDAEIQSALGDLSNRNFMVYHPAWGYFARDYQLNQFGVEADGKEPSPRELVRFINLAKSNNITVIFVQEQVSVAGATAIAEGVGGTVYVIDPLAKNYIENTRSVSQAILKVLEPPCDCEEDH